MLSTSYLLISVRYLQAAHNNPTIRTMIKICFYGIFIGSFSLALIVSIVQGFHQATYQKMQSIYPQIIIDADGQDLNYQKISTILQDPIYNIAYFAPQQTAQVLCNSLNSKESAWVVQLKGIEPELEQKVTPLHQMILPKHQDHELKKIIMHNQIIVGKQLAQKMNLSTGSIIHIMYTTQDNMAQAVDFEQEKVIVSGIFDTGIEDFDANFIYCSSTFFNQIFPDSGISTIYAQIKKDGDEQKVIQNLHEKLHINVYSWKKLYTSLVAALELEKYATFLILLLIILVASSNIISLLFMQITQKRKDIALLLIFGLPPAKIKNIFLLLSMSISIVATTCGLIFAWIMGLFLQHYRWIKLPDNIYYTTHLPIILDIHLFLFIFFVVLTISFFASLVPLKKIKMKDIATVLQNQT